MDLNLLAGALRGVTKVNGSQQAYGAAGAMRVALNLQAVLPVLQAQGSAVSTQFSQDLNRVAAEAARGLTTVYVVQPAAGGALRIEAGNQALQVPAALRETVLALLQNAASGTATTTPAPPSALPTAQNMPANATVNVGTLAGVQVLWSQAQTQEATAGAFAARGARRGAPSHEAIARLNVDGPLLEGGAHPELAAVRLQRAVEHSGLFFEAHLAQWSSGARSADEMRSELARLQRLDAGGASAVSGERVAAQLDVLQKAAFVVQSQAWTGQPCTIEFREQVQPDGAGQGLVGQAQPPVVCATVVLELPRLGPLEVELKLAGHSVAVQTRAQPQAAASVSAALVDLGQALQARGLNPAALSVGALELERDA